MDTLIASDEADAYTLPELQIEPVGDGGYASVALTGPAAQLFRSATDTRQNRLLVSATSADDLAGLATGTYDLIVNRQKVNNARYLNKLFEAVNARLTMGGVFVGFVETADQRRRRLFERMPTWAAAPVYAGDFVLRRVGPKLRATRKLYFGLTRGRNRVLTIPEVLGRLVSCGFEIVEYGEVDGRTQFVVRKTGEPAFDMQASYGPLFAMRRVGKGGRIIHVYKLRTMHPYAEYLQRYVYETHSLDETGKFKDDFRITAWGRVMRRLWIDELPMLINWVRRDLKLVGVRPISQHYLSLYPPEVIERRKKHKPGLVPPFYADLPTGFDEVVRSEVAYMEAYERHPILTDARYFCRAAYNILVKRARSQ
jgi:lipopolysaccharide/colanic/teichoic acid biosynthesis glycosyltransferase